MQRFEELITYIVLSGIALVSILHPDVQVDDTVIVTAALIIIGALSGQRRWLELGNFAASNLDFGYEAQYWIDRFEDKFDVDVPTFVENAIVEIADDLDAELTVVHASGEDAVDADAA